MDVVASIYVFIGKMRPIKQKCSARMRTNLVGRCTAYQIGCGKACNVICLSFEGFEWLEL